MKAALDKTEVLSLGTALEDIRIDGLNINPCKSIKILGVTVQANGKFDMMLNEKCTKIRKLASNNA